MAITITQQPELFSLSRQTMIVGASSDNYTEDGFKFVVTVTSTNATTISAVPFYISPNQANVLLFDLAQLFFSQRMRESFVHDGDNSVVFNDDSSSYSLVDVQIDEAWLIAGVLTVNPGAGASIDQMTIACGFFDPIYGFMPDPEGTNTDVSFTLNSTTSRFMSDRKHDTHVWKYAETFGFTPSTQNTFIPVFETDHGFLTAFISTLFITNTELSYIRLTIFDSTGTPHSVDFTPDGGSLVEIQAYPANLNDSTVVGMEKPSDYPGWHCYSIRAYNSSDIACSMTVVFYNALLYGQHDCQYDRVRLGWNNSRGGWDYFNFIKRNEETLSMERKRFHKVQGNYAASTFNYLAYEGGLTERSVIAQQGLNITSDWIQENEFVFLKSLMVSRQVHWVQDDGSFIPVVIEASDYVSKRERNYKLKNLELKLRLAHNLTA